MDDVEKELAKAEMAYQWVGSQHKMKSRDYVKGLIKARIKELQTIQSEVDRVKKAMSA